MGSILEYRYDIRYDDNSFSCPFWEIQRGYFVHKAHYCLHTLSGLPERLAESNQ